MVGFRNTKAAFILQDVEGAEQPTIVPTAEMDEKLRVEVTTAQSQRVHTLRQLLLVASDELYRDVLFYQCVMIYTFSFSFRASLPILTIFAKLICGRVPLGSPF